MRVEIADQYPEFIISPRQPSFVAGSQHPFYSPPPAGIIIGNGIGPDWDPTIS
jgi:hypothetical protein